MPWPKLWLVLHLFFGFTFVGSLILAEWAGGAARRATEWRDRALLYGILARAALWAGLIPLILLGIFGNLVASGTGLSMGSPWMRMVNVVWLFALIVMVAVSLPSIARLERVSRAAAGGGAAEGYDGALRSWRLGNITQTILYVVALVLMVSGARL